MVPKRKGTKDERTILCESAMQQSARADVVTKMTLDNSSKPSAPRNERSINDHLSIAASFPLFPPPGDQD
jgi:hypothetical protein